MFRSLLVSWVVVASLVVSGGCSEPSAEETFEKRLLAEVASQNSGLPARPEGDDATLLRVEADTTAKMLTLYMSTDALTKDHPQFATIEELLEAAHLTECRVPKLKWIVDGGYGIAYHYVDDAGEFLFDFRYTPEQILKAPAPASEEAGG
ncbi:MAG: hypothetical protein AAF581_01200 [Planctomycetota bacterium]